MGDGLAEVKFTNEQSTPKVTDLNYLPANAIDRDLGTSYKLTL